MINQQIQQKWHNIQKALEVKVVSDDRKIEIVFNGLVQIKRLVIDRSLLIEDIPDKLINLINGGIQKTAQQSQSEFLRFKKREGI